MSKIYPLYLSGVVGFMMWHLQKGQPPGDVLILAMEHKRFIGIPLDEMQLALERAQSNLRATEKARMLAGQWTLKDDNTWGPE